MNKEEFLNMVTEHELWLKTKGEEGKRLVLRDERINNVSLNDINLNEATLINVDFKSSYLENIYFINSDLHFLNFKYSTIKNSYFNNADLQNSNFQHAFIENSSFLNSCLSLSDFSFGVTKNCNFSRATFARTLFVKAGIVNSNFKVSILHETIFTKARIENTSFKETKINHLTTGLYSSCPEEGSFIGFKKANNCLVKLKILSDARRSSATGHKCRCDKAKVLKITDLKTGEEVKEVNSSYDHSFIYKVGKVVDEPSFNENRWNECTEGIHFFLSKELAMNW